MTIWDVEVGDEKLPSRLPIAEMKNWSDALEEPEVIEKVTKVAKGACSRVTSC